MFQIIQLKSNIIPEMEKSLQNILCHSCGQKQLISLTDENCGMDLLEEGITCNLPEIACKHCKVRYMGCPNCENLVLMKFLGHDLICPHGKNYYSAPEWCSNEVFEDCGTCIGRKYTFMNGKDSHIIGAGYADKNVHYVDLKTIVNDENNSITGDDGGLYHYWFCERCKRVFADTDK